jgi:hypothetical protein
MFGDEGAVGKSLPVARHQPKGHECIQQRFDAALVAAASLG